MRVYLAGGMGYRKILFPQKRGQQMNIHLVVGSGQYRKHVIPSLRGQGEGLKMNIHLAGIESRADTLKQYSEEYRPYILESFLNVSAQSEKYLQL